MEERMSTSYMFLVEGVDSIGDPVKALVPARDHADAKRKIREEYQGGIKNLRASRVTGYEWDELLKGYGTKYGELNRYEAPRGDFSFEANRYSITSGRPIFI